MLVQNIIAKFTNFFRSNTRIKKVVFLHEVPAWLGTKRKTIYEKKHLAELLDLTALSLARNRQSLASLLDILESKENAFNFLDEGKILAIFSTARNILTKLQVHEKMKLDQLSYVIESFEDELGELLLSLIEARKKLSSAMISQEQRNEVEKHLQSFSELVVSLKRIIDNYTEKLQECSWNSLTQLERISKELDRLLNKEIELKEKETFQTARSRRVKEQIEEKNLELLKIKDSHDYQLLANTKTEEKLMKKRLDELEDEMFVYLTKLKNSLSDLVDFNSNYRLLDIIQRLRSFQENLNFLFDLDKFNHFVHSLTWVESQIKSGNLQEKESSEYGFSRAFYDLHEGSMKQLMDEYEKTRIKLQVLPQKRLESSAQDKVNDASYRLEHFKNQKSMLDGNLRNIEIALAKNKASQEQKKRLFENLLHISFDVYVELSLIRPEPEVKVPIKALVIKKEVPQELKTQEEKKVLESTIEETIRKVHERTPSFSSPEQE